MSKPEPNRRGTGAATMITDPLFYRLFETSPETFFLLLGKSADVAAEVAARYQYTAPEFKETSHRVDGVFLPREAGLPVYFLEVQFYPLPNVYAGLLAKVYMRRWACRSCTRLGKRKARLR